MARSRYPRSSGPRPPALPPAAQTVGQLVAETIRRYGAHLRVVLPLGAVFAIADQVAFEWGNSRTGRTIIFVAAAPAFAAAYTYASALVFRVALDRATALRSVALGTLVFIPAALFMWWFSLVSIAWLALWGHVVPATVSERLRPVAAFRRAREVASADYVHAVGGLATLYILAALMRILLVQLLHSQADNTIRVAAFVADVVLTPILFLGGALLYGNLVARVGLDRDARRAARANAESRPG